MTVQARASSTTRVCAVCALCMCAPNPILWFSLLWGVVAVGPTWLSCQPRHIRNKRNFWMNVDARTGMHAGVAAPAVAWHMADSTILWDYH